MQIIGAIAAVFALLLLTLPTLRVVQGHLTPRQAMGLWISGAGFLLLALGALVLVGDAGRHATLAGVVAAVIGNIVQRRSTQPPRE
jgi:hypothetical protein